MNAHVRSHFVGIVVLLAGCTGTPAVAPATNRVALTTEGLSRTDDCLATSQWVQAHAAELPTTLAELSRFPSNYRVAIVATLSDDAKQALFYEQFSSYLDGAGEFALNAAQRDRVRALRDQLGTYFADDQATRALLSPDFSHEEIATLIAILGPSDDSGLRPIVTDSREACQCSSSSDWCWWGSDCEAQTGCSHVNGCGSWMSHPCDGMCH